MIRGNRAYSEQLSEKMGISPKYLSCKVRGKANPTLITFLKLPDCLEVEIFEMYNFTHELSSDRELRKILNSLLKEPKGDSLKRIVKIVKGVLR